MSELKGQIRNSSVLVTGGAGFIGSNLIDALLTQNNKVVCLDNFSTGQKKNIEQHLNNDNFTLIHGDIRNLEECLIASKKVDYILHQAALGSVPRSIKDPITSNEVNVSGFLNMLIAARDNKVKRFVYAASSSTYGDHPGLPKVEGKIGKPLSPYAVTKYVNELYADVFYKTYGVETIGLRYFNVFGKRQDPDGAYAAVIPKFISQLINNESPTVNGDGKTSRDFTYIDNVIQINQLAAITANSKAVNKVFNVAYGGRVSLIEMFSSIKTNLAKYADSIENVDLIFGPERAGDVKHSQADISFAKNELGYEPKFDFEKGMKEYINWYWNNKS